MLNMFGNLLQLPGAMGLSSEEELPSLLAQQQQPSWEERIPVVGPALSTAREIDKIYNSVSSWFGVRGLTLLLGVMLIAAALFSHPAVREKLVSAGKAAGEAGALAA